MLRRLQHPAAVGPAARSCVLRPFRTQPATPTALAAQNEHRRALSLPFEAQLCGRVGLLPSSQLKCLCRGGWRASPLSLATPCTVSKCISLEVGSIGQKAAEVSQTHTSSWVTLQELPRESFMGLLLYSLTAKPSTKDICECGICRVQVGAHWDHPAPSPDLSWERLGMSLQASSSVWAFHPPHPLAKANLLTSPISDVDKHSPQSHL